MTPPGGLGDLTWPEAAAAADAGAVLVLPVGSTEQHGPHLALGTDTVVAVAVAQGLAARRPDCLVAPALPYGSSGEHAGFTGTLSTGGTALRDVVVELVRSADAFAGVVVVSGHGGNAAALTDAVARSVADGRATRLWAPTGRVLRAAGLPADAHAGRTETSLLLAVDPAAVRPGRAEPGVTADVAALAGQLRDAGVAAVSPNGVLGDPTGASAAEGRALLDALVADLVASLAGWPAPAGRRGPPAG